MHILHISHCTTPGSSQHGLNPAQPCTALRLTEMTIPHEFVLPPSEGIFEERHSIAEAREGVEQRTALLHRRHSDGKKKLPKQ